MADWLALLALAHKIPDLQPIGSGTPVLYFTEPFIITLPSSGYDLNNVERDVNHQIIFLREVDILSRETAQSKVTLYPSEKGSTLREKSKLFPFRTDSFFRRETTV